MQLEDGAERERESTRGSDSRHRGGTEGEYVCVCVCIQPVTVAHRLRQAIKAADCETLHTPHRQTCAHTRTEASPPTCTASLRCDGKGRELFWDKVGTAFKVGTVMFVFEG